MTVNFLKVLKNTRGEIATVLTLITVGLMGIGIAAGSYLAQQTTQLQSNAADCATISDVSQSPDSELDPGDDFTCNVTIDEGHSGSRNISCGWSENGGWPQTGDRWEGATCNGINCSFGIAAPAQVDENAVYELVGFDMSTGCGPQSGTRVPFKLKGATEPPPRDEKNICKDKPDGYRAKYDVYEECDTNLKKWVIIDGICRDGEVKEEPACATCDSCEEAGKRDAQPSSLQKNECTPGGCDGSGGGGGGGGGGGDDNGDGDGDGNNGGGNNDIRNVGEKKVSGTVTVYNPGKTVGYNRVFVTICGNGEKTQESCTPERVEIDYVPKSGDTDNGITRVFTYSFKADGKKNPIVLNGSYLLLAQVVDTGGGCADGSGFCIRKTVPVTKTCDSFPCGENFSITLGNSTAIPLTIKGTVTVETGPGLSYDYITVERCSKGPNGPQTPCTSDNQAIAPDPNTVNKYTFHYETGGNNIPFMEGETYPIAAYAYKSDGTWVGESQRLFIKTAASTNPQEDIKLTIILSKPKTDASLTGKVTMKGDMTNSIPLVQLCHVGTSGSMENCKKRDTFDNTAIGEYTYKFNVIPPGQNAIFIDSTAYDKDTNVATSLDMCSSVEAVANTCTSPAPEVKNTCYVDTSTKAGPDFTVTMNNPDNTIKGDVTVVPAGGVTANDYNSIAVWYSTAIIYPDKEEEKNDPSKSLLIGETYAFCGLKKDIPYSISAKVLKLDYSSNPPFTVPAFQKSEFVECISKSGTDAKKDESDPKNKSCTLKPPGVSSWILGVAKNQNDLNTLTLAMSQKQLEEAFAKLRNGDPGAVEHLSAVIHGLTKTFGLQMKPCKPQWGECNVQI